MAKFNVQKYFSQTYEVTARCSNSDYNSIDEFINAVNEWLDVNNIKYVWSGESTQDYKSHIVYCYHVLIADEKNGTHFALRWS